MERRSTRDDDRGSRAQRAGEQEPRRQRIRVEPADEVVENRDVCAEAGVHHSLHAVVGAE